MDLDWGWALDLKSLCLRSLGFKTWLKRKYQLGSDLLHGRVFQSYVLGTLPLENFSVLEVRKVDMLSMVNVKVLYTCFSDLSNIVFSSNSSL